jgi:hypothetical protein
MSIPASQIVQVNPGVISGGGNALALNGILLTNNSAVPVGAVQWFPTAASVSAFFGPTSNEAAMAGIYFMGRNNATVMPAQLGFTQYASAAVPAWLRGANLGAMTLTQLKALSGTLTLTVNGTATTSAAINLSAATSFSNVATLIQAGFTTPPFAVTYDSQRNAFVFTTTLTGATATITTATGTLSEGLLLATDDGAVVSQGAPAGVPADVMTQVTAQTLNWGIFSTVFEATVSDKVAFAAWANSQNNRFAYVLWSTEVAALSTPDTTTSLSQVITAGYSGTCGVYCDPILDPNGLAAAFVLGATASIDFNRTNGRITYAFKYTSGVPASVTGAVQASNLQANGYNYVGSYATANDQFTFAYPGSVTGPYKFLDEFINQVYLNSQLQLALMTLLTGVPSIPYNNSGYAMIDAACMDPINQALNFGSIRPGVPLSALQAAEVNNAAGIQIDGTLSTRGWYLQIQPATAQIRASRASPSMTCWYMDGGSVQKITLASILVQ